MEQVTTIAEVRSAVAEAKAEGRCVGFVPTMGNLHEGHFSLIRSAEEACDFVVVSIFVNPTQFGPGEDYQTYPRTPQQDLQGCGDSGADLVFLPTVEEMYPTGSFTTVHVDRLTQVLCGASRPGHFDGVCTVVAKLLNIVGPHRAFFGAKDYQQATVITRMASDLNMPVQIVTCPTVRESDGLAMSSRNRYLSPEQRREAPGLHEALQAGAAAVRQGAGPEAVAQVIRSHLAENVPGGTVDYVEVRDPRTLEPLDRPGGPTLLALAVRLGPARLIDNIVVDAPGG
ncbi:MAG: pantoate--beta-alanine ligase [Phycisphaerae bacterium]